MKAYEKFAAKIFPWETGKTIDKAEFVHMIKLNADPGGWTKFGITLETWQTVGYDKDGDGDIDADDLAFITVEDYERTLKTRFWDKWRADEIRNESIAMLLVDWVWASGAYGIWEPQKLLGVKVDGKVGPKTIDAINSWSDQQDLFDRIHISRMQFIERIVLYEIKKYLKDVNPNAQMDELMKKTTLQFKQGWINRVDSYHFEP